MALQCRWNSAAKASDIGWSTATPGHGFHHSFGKKVSRGLPIIITLEAPRDLTMPRSRKGYLHVISMRRLGAKTPNKQEDRTDMLEHTTTRPGVVRIVSILMTNRIILNIGLLGLCAAYLQGGIDKLLDFNGAVAETERLGLNPALLLTVATIFTELAASA